MKRKQPLHPDSPLLHACHSKPISRRDFIACGLSYGAAVLTSGSVLGLFANPNAAYAGLSADLEALKQQCGINVQGAGKIPFACSSFMKSDICFGVIPLLTVWSTLSLPDSNPKKMHLQPDFLRASIFFPDRSALDIPPHGLLKLSMWPQKSSKLCPLNELFVHMSTAGS